MPHGMFNVKYPNHTANHPLGLLGSFPRRGQTSLESTVCGKALDLGARFGSREPTHTSKSRTPPALSEKEQPRPSGAAA